MKEKSTLTADVIEQKAKELADREAQVEALLAQKEAELKDKMEAAELAVKQTEEKLKSNLGIIEKLVAEKEAKEKAEMTDFVSNLSFVTASEQEGVTSALFALRDEEGFSTITGLLEKAQASIGTFAEEESGHSEAGEVEFGADFHAMVMKNLKAKREGK